MTISMYRENSLLLRTRLQYEIDLLNSDYSISRIKNHIFGTYLLGTMHITHEGVIHFDIVALF